MTLLNLCLTLGLVGIATYGFNKYVTFVDAKIKNIINIVILVCSVLYALHAFGIANDIGNIPLK